MSGGLIGYARVSTDEQDLTAQRDAQAAFGVTPERIYVDHGLTGTHRDRKPAGSGRVSRRHELRDVIMARRRP